MKNMSSQTKNMIFVIIIIIVATVYYMFAGTNAVTLNIGETSFVLGGPEEVKPIEIAFDKVTEFELIEGEVDFGETKDIFENGNYVFATYSNEDWGEYKAYYDKKIDCFIAAHTDEGVTLFNFESANTTAEFHRSFSEFLQDF